MTNLMVRSLFEVAMYTKIHIRYGVVNICETVISGKHLVAEVLNKPPFTVGTFNV
jgi:hypothetical protein